MRALNILGIAMILPITLLAHGEDKPGPHGGYIRMPGGFHTEVKLTEKNLQIYLLDIHWKEPVTEKSKVEVEYKTATGTTKLACRADQTFFACELPKGFKKDTGKLMVMAERKGMKGAKAEYDLPLKLLNQKDEHSSHH